MYFKFEFSKRIKKGGFTLPEILAVMAIVGVLAALTIVGVRTMRSRAQDTQRKSDIAQLKRAFQEATFGNKKYPVSYSDISCATKGTEDLKDSSCTGKYLLGKNLLSSIPLDKYLNNQSYKYFSSKGKTFRVCSALQGRSGYSFVGSPEGLREVANDDIDNCLADFKEEFISDGNGDYFGWAVSRIGDQDGDGREDIIIGAPFADPGGKSDAGSAFVFSSKGNLLMRFDGEIENISGRDYPEQMGGSVAAIDDLDGDGKQDILVGAPFRSTGPDTPSGYVYIFSSKSTIDSPQTIKKINGGSAPFSHSIGSMFGYSLAVIKDKSGGSKKYLAIGAPYDNGSVGSRAGKVDIVEVGGSYPLIQKFQGENMSANFGYSLSAIEDMSGDNIEDIVIGSPYAGNTGAIYIYTTPISSSPPAPLIKKINGVENGQNFGYGVARISNRDTGSTNSKEDVAIVAPRSGVGGGFGYVYLFSSESMNQLVRYDIGTTDGQDLGFSVANIKDLDGDGNDEVLAGNAYVDDGTKVNTGAIYIFYSKGGTTATMYGATADDKIGFAIGAIGDLDWDKFEDIIVGAPEAAPSGYVKIFPSK